MAPASSIASRGSSCPARGGPHSACSPNSKIPSVCPRCPPTSRGRHAMGDDEIGAAACGRRRSILGCLPGSSRFVQRVATLPEVRAAVEANHDDNKWWPTSVEDPRTRMLVAGCSTRHPQVRSTSASSILQGDAVRGALRAGTTAASSRWTPAWSPNSDRPSAWHCPAGQGPTKHYACCCSVASSTELATTFS